MLLVAAMAFFVASEFALLAVDRTRLQSRAVEGDRRARVALSVQRRLSFHLSGAQLGLTVVSLAIGIVSEPAIAKLLQGPLGAVLGEQAAEAVAIAVAIGIASTVSMVLGELIPKNVAIADGEAAALRLAPALRIFSAVFSPLIALTNGTANVLVRALGVEPREDLDASRSREELARVIRESEAEGTLGHETGTLLARTIRFADKSAADVLVPRGEVQVVGADASVATLAAKSLATGLSRFPVVTEHVDEIVGMVHVKDIFAVEPDHRDEVLVTSVMGDALFVPETRDLEGLFTDLRRESRHLAVVVDEHGGTAGIVTFEDVLEELVGEIDDEYDTPTTAVRADGPGAWLADGTLHRDELDEASGFRFPEGPFDTIAGFVLATLGHLAEPGETVVHEGWTVAVRTIDGRRVATVRLVAPPVSAAAPADDT